MGNHHVLKLKGIDVFLNADLETPHMAFGSVHSREAGYRVGISESLGSWELGADKNIDPERPQRPRWRSREETIKRLETYNSAKKEMSPLSREAPGNDVERARISIYTPKSKVYGIKETERTLADLFEEGRKITGDGPFLGSTTGQGYYSFISYNDADTIRRHLGAAMVNRGLKKGDFVGISSQNTPEWSLLALGCDTQSLTMVPLYDTLGEEGVKHILNQTELSVLFAHPKTLESYLKYLPCTKSVKLIVKMPSEGKDGCSEEEMAAAKSADVELLSWTDLVRSGQLNQRQPNFPTPDDTVTLCYTSGTTGFPKGAMLTHRSLCASVEGVMQQLNEDRIRTSDVHISYLPAAHIFERLVQSAVISVGGSIGFWQGDVKKLSSDMQALKPSIFPAVPRILNKLYDKVMSEVAMSKIKAWAFNLALSNKLKDVQNGNLTRDSVWDRLIFKKIQNMLGGNIRLVAVGAAPVKPDILQFFRATLGASVFEGYGQTECCGACCVTHYADHSLGHVGGVISCSQIKLADVEDKGYYAKDNKGEICIKGVNVFSGYYKNEEKTKEAIDEDGWLHTGDIGEWNSKFGLTLIDRKKNIFKLSQGEYIAPEKIELLFDRALLVGQSLVYGDSLKCSLIAIIVPDELATIAWAHSKGYSGSLETLCQKTELKDEIMKQVNEKGKDGGLKGFEFAKMIHLSHETFAVENDLSTPTFKLKRHNIIKYFKTEIEEMYSHLE